MASSVRFSPSTSQIPQPRDCESNASSDTPSDRADNHARQSTERAGQSFTLRSVFVGISLGVFVCICNLYFGLQTGNYSGMSPTVALLGFAILKPIAARTATPFSPQENVLVQTVAGALGCMPATVGLLTVIPALEYLVRPGEGGSLKLGYPVLVLWSLGLTFFGLIFAFFFRRQYVVEDKLPWPGAKAVASLIRLLHAKTGSNPEDTYSSISSTALLQNTHTGSTIHARPSTKIQAAIGNLEIRALTLASVYSSVVVGCPTVKSAMNLRC